MATKTERAQALLTKAAELGCEAKLQGNWVMFSPPLPAELILEAASLGNELAALVK